MGINLSLVPVQQSYVYPILPVGFPSMLGISTKICGMTIPV
jgi:hypothetical protein